MRVATNLFSVETEFLELPSVDLSGSLDTEDVFFRVFDLAAKTRASNQGVRFLVSARGGLAGKEGLIANAMVAGALTTGMRASDVLLDVTLSDTDNADMPALTKHGLCLALRCEDAKGLSIGSLTVSGARVLILGWSVLLSDSGQAAAAAASAAGLQVCADVGDSATGRMEALEAGADILLSASSVGSDDSMAVDKVRRIMAVDDEPSILSSLKRALRMKGVEILTFVSANEALESLLAGSNPGVIISDMRMPEMPGILFLEKAQEIAPDATRIILSGYTEVTSIINALNKGVAWRFLTKPWDEEELKETVAAGLSISDRSGETRLLRDSLKRTNAELDRANREMAAFMDESTKTTAVTGRGQGMGFAAACPLPVVVLGASGNVVFSNRAALLAFADPEGVARTVLDRAAPCSDGWLVEVFDADGSTALIFFRSADG